MRKGLTDGEILSLLFSGTNAYDSAAGAERAACAAAGDAFQISHLGALFLDPQTCS